MEPKENKKPRIELAGQPDIDNSPETQSDLQRQLEEARNEIAEKDRLLLLQQELTVQQNRLRERGKQSNSPYLNPLHTDAIGLVHKRNALLSKPKNQFTLDDLDEVNLLAKQIDEVYVKNGITKPVSSIPKERIVRDPTDRPFHLPQDARPGYSRRIINIDVSGQRMENKKMEGWAVVNSGIDVGGGMKACLCEIPIEIANERRRNLEEKTKRRQQQEIDEIHSSINRGAREQYEGGYGYINIEQS